MKKQNKDPAVEKELKDLRLQVSYYKKLSEILETENEDVKKSAWPSGSSSRSGRQSRESLMRDRAATA